MEEIVEKFKKLPQKKKIIIIAIFIIIILIAFYLIYKTFYIEDIELPENENINQSTEETKNEERESKIGILENKKTVTIHIVGEVNSPGVYTLNEGARIIDAINAAEGYTEEADLSKINLAYIIDDGIQVYIPSIRENRNQAEESEESFIKGDAGKDIISDSITQEINKNKENIGNESKININTANLERLQMLPGIGLSTAQKIIEYREQNGKFKTTDDIKNVNGIGENKYEIIKEKITVK